MPFETWTRACSANVFFSHHCTASPISRRRNEEQEVEAPRRPPLRIVASGADAGKRSRYGLEMAGSVLSVNVAEPREIEWLGRRATTSIWKEPVEGRGVGELNLARRRAGRPPLPRRRRQGDLRVRARGLRLVGGRARPPAGRRDLRREPHARGRRRHCAVVGERWRSARRSSRSRGRERPAGSSARGWRAWSSPSTSRRPGGPAPTCACSSKASWARATRSRSSTGQATGLTVGDVAEIYHGDRARCEELLRAPEIGGSGAPGSGSASAGATASLPG